MKTCRLTSLFIAFLFITLISNVIASVPLSEFSGMFDRYEEPKLSPLNGVLIDQSGILENVRFYGRFSTMHGYLSYKGG